MNIYLCIIATNVYVLYNLYKICGNYMYRLAMVAVTHLFVAINNFRWWLQMVVASNGGNRSLHLVEDCGFW